MPAPKVNQTLDCPGWAGAALTLVCQIVNPIAIHHCAHVTGSQARSIVILAVLF